MKTYIKYINFKLDQFNIKFIYWIYIVKIYILSKYQLIIYIYNFFKYLFFNLCLFKHCNKIFKISLHYPHA